MATRRERQRRQVRCNWAKARAQEAESIVDPAAEFVEHLTAIPLNGIALYIRGTVEKIRRDGRLESQFQEALAMSAALDATEENGLIRRVFMGIESGKANAERPLMDEADSWCLENAVLLVGTERSRYHRPSNWNGRWEWEPPSLEDWQLYRSRWKCRIATFHPPTLTSAEARKTQIRRGQKNGRGGRPKGINNPLFEDAIRMRKQGLSLGCISKALCVSRSTIQGWINY